MMTLLLWTACVLLLFYMLLLLVYFIGWVMIKPFTPNDEREHLNFTIIIPARNEEHAITACLESIAKQQYPHACWEVIVVNDYSTDGTAQVVERFIQQHPQLNIQQLHMHEHPQQHRLKKAAITFAIQKASYHHIILTDADCSRGHNWLATINSFLLKTGSKMVYAPVAFKATNLFEKIQSLEFAGLVAIGAAAIRLRNPNMCSAANLIFEKKVFNEVGGYTGVDGVASGDDEFLLHRVFKAYPDKVQFLKHIDALVETTANASIKQLADQRRRWVSKSTKYENRYITAIMVGAYLFNAGVLFFLIANWRFGILLLLGKILAEGLLLFAVMSFYKRRVYLVFLPLAELFHIVYVLIIGIWGNLGTYQWKGRRLK